MAVPVFDVLEWFHGEQTRLIDRECAAQRERSREKHADPGDGCAQVEARSVGQPQGPHAGDHPTPASGQELLGNHPRRAGAQRSGRNGRVGSKRSGRVHADRSGTSPTP